MLPPDQADKLLNNIPPLLDGYEAVCAAIAIGDTPMAFYIAKVNARNAKAFKKKLNQCFSIREQKRASNQY